MYTAMLSKISWSKIEYSPLWQLGYNSSGHSGTVLSKFALQIGFDIPNVVLPLLDVFQMSLAW